MYIYVVVQFYPWFKNSFLLFLGMVMYDNNIIMSLKQKKRRFEPRIKLNHNIYKLQRPCQFNNSTRTDGKFSVVARHLVVTVHHSRVPPWNAFISTTGFGSIKSYVFTEHNEHIRHIKFFITYQYICTLNEEPTDPGKSLLGLSNLFFTWNFLDRLKQTFLQLTFFLLKNTGPA